MNRCSSRSRLFFAAVILGLSVSPAVAQDEFVPQPGQPGKDVVWVPTPPELVERMMDLAAVTPQDFVIDLGSGDGRNVIAAAKRGARALGVEYNPNMVTLSKKNAAAAGVAGSSCARSFSTSARAAASSRTRLGSKDGRRTKP
jgi:hypothetical protein